MPAGLDGWPDPVVTDARNEVLEAVAALVSATASGRDRTLVAVDGRSGSGKSTFADELAARLAGRGVASLRSTTDSFHRPRVERLHRGGASAEGYYLDSHQLDVIVDELLLPFARGGAQVRVAAFDEPSDQPVHVVAEVVGPTVLLFDGLFLQRPELAAHWDHVVFLSADERLDDRWLRFLLSDLPTNSSSRAALLDERLGIARWPRYRHGWARYLEADRPTERADVVIDNNDFAVPRIMHGRN